LTAVGLQVWLTFPQSVQAALDDLWTVARLFRSDLARMKVDLLERSLEWARLAKDEQSQTRVFCPIWQDRLESGEMWWMTFNRQTYPSDLLLLLGAENVFAHRERRYPLLADLGQAAAEAPGERDTRYPRVTRAMVMAAQPELILLPSEPFAYSHDNIAEIRAWFSGTPAVENDRIIPIEGSLLMWPGTRLGKALGELGGIFSS
jgi:ABC-type Fe3+-hydroxamate transport system substrate-binding protein